jgi:hypothetical protein
MFLVGKPGENRPLGQLGVDGKIVLKRNLQEMDGGHGLD